MSAFASGALQQHRTRAQRQQFDQGGIRGLIVIDGMAEQQLSFGNVRREDRRQWEQPRAAGRRHNRVEHDMRRLVVRQRIGNRIDHFGVGKYAELDRTDTESVEACVDLRADAAAAAAAGVGAGDGEGADGAGVGAGHESIVGSEDDELRCKVAAVV